MKKYSVPNLEVILSYHDIFGTDEPKDRLSILKNVSKDFVIAELSGLNYRLKGGVKKEIDSSFITQTKELFYFCGKDQYMYQRYAKLIDQKSGGRKTLLFSRQTCLFGLEEVIQSELATIADFNMTPIAWEAVLKYILCINAEITRVKKETATEKPTLETLNPKLLPISELLLFNDPFYVVYRGWHYMEYLAGHDETKVYLSDYFKEKYQVPYDRFVFELYRMWIANKQQQQDWNFYYIIPEEEETKHLFDELSKKTINAEFIKLINIRKNPFYKHGNNHYILTDINILLEKAYNQFINDFWFDKLKGLPNNKGKEFKFQDYKSMFGRFFEEYVDNIVRFSLEKARTYIIKTFDELKIGKSQIESGDVYFRDGNKVFLAEVKSTSIYDNEKYSGDVQALYKNDRNKFFSDFGLDQLAGYIKDFQSNFKGIDPEAFERKKLRIWPVLIFNERLFQTPFMAPVFVKRFKELMHDYKNSSIYVYPLTIIHITDLENMECTLNRNPHVIWKLLTLNFRQKSRFIPPFYITLNRNDIRANYRRIIKKITPLFDRFKKENKNVDS